MKKNFIYLGIILCVGLLEVACEKQEPVHYENNPGLYFYKRTIQGAPIPFFYRRVTLSGIPFGSMSE